MVAQCVNARTGYSDRHADVVVFAGSGSTGAIDRLVRALGAHVPLPVHAPREARPVVFVGPHEHHSNILPWRESCAVVVEIPETKRRTGGRGRVARGVAAIRVARDAHREFFGGE